MKKPFWSISAMMQSTTSLPETEGNKARRGRPREPTPQACHCRCRRRARPRREREEVRGVRLFLLFFLFLLLPANSLDNRAFSSSASSFSCFSFLSLTFSCSLSLSFSSSSSFRKRAIPRRNRVVVTSTPSAPPPRHGMARRGAPEHGQAGLLQDARPPPRTGCLRCPWAVVRHTPSITAVMRGCSQFHRDGLPLVFQPQAQPSLPPPPR